MLRWKNHFLAFPAKFQPYDKIRLPYLRITKKKNLKGRPMSLQRWRQTKALLLPLPMGMLECGTAQAGNCLLQEGKAQMPPAWIKRRRCGRNHFGTALLQYAAIGLSFQRCWENIVLLSSRHSYFSQRKNKLEQICQIFSFIEK